MIYEVIEFDPVTWGWGIRTVHNGRGGYGGACSMRSYTSKRSAIRAMERFVGRIIATEEKATSLPRARVRVCDRKEN